MSSQSAPCQGSFGSDGNSDFARSVPQGTGGTGSQAPRKREPSCIQGRFQSKQDSVLHWSIVSLSYVRKREVVKTNSEITHILQNKCILHMASVLIHIHGCCWSITICTGLRSLPAASLRPWRHGTNHRLPAGHLG